MELTCLFEEKAALSGGIGYSLHCVVFGILVISNFGFRGMVLVLIVPVVTACFFHFSQRVFRKVPTECDCHRESNSLLV